MTRRMIPTISAVCLAIVLAACSGAPGDEAGEGVADDVEVQSSGNPVIDLLKSGEPVFGLFSGEKSREGGITIMATRDADFILYSMESGPFDVPLMQEYMEGMAQAGGASALLDFPVLVRTPAIHTDPGLVAGYVSDAMATGITGIVFPHVVTADEAAQSVELLGTPWAPDTEGTSIDVLIVENKEGIANVRDIVATPGLSVVFAGPGDLRRAYDRDMEAVEAAIQAVLAACLEFDVACGITAGVDDIGTRLDEGFRVIIVTAPEALAVGLAHAGRTSTAMSRRDG